MPETALPAIDPGTKPARRVRAHPVPRGGAPLGKGRRLWVALVGLLAMVAGCGASRPAAGRAEWLRQELLRRHQELLVRDAPAVGRKLERMARSSFDFFRGSAGLAAPEPSRFLTPASSAVAVIGDPHPENIGTFTTPRGEQVVDFNDFDLAGQGAYVHDLRRLALGLWLLADMADLSRKQRVRLVEAALDGYLAELRAEEGGAPPVRLRVDTAFGGDLPDILASVDDREREPVAALEPAERQALVAALPEYHKTLVAPGAFAAAAFTLKRATRVEVGVASLPVRRYWVVVEGPAEGDDDDWTLEWKEVRGRSAAALVRLQRAFQEMPDNDAWLGHAQLGGQQFRVRRVSADQRRLSVEKIAKAVKGPRWGKKDLRLLGEESGRLLARGHARAPDAQGKPGLAAILAAVGDGRGLAYETAQLTATAARQVEADRDHLRALLRQHGPLLGWTPAKK